MKSRRPEPRRRPSGPRSSGPRPPERRSSVDRARWVIGIHSCEEALRVRPKGIREVWLREKFEDSQTLRDIEDLANRARIKVHIKPTGVIDKLGTGHQGVALAATETPEIDWQALETEENAIIILLDGIEDPHNLGAILRTAWLVGAKGVVIPSDRAVGLTPTVCKVASGGAEHIPVHAEANLASVLERLKEIGFWSFGLSEKGTRLPWDFKLSGKVAWVIGSEGSGLRIPTERACDELVRIPQVATGSSYNASIAAAMALMETCRQMGSPS